MTQRRHARRATQEAPGHTKQADPIVREGSDLERAFDTRLRQLAPHLPPPVAEHRFAPPRRWRFDRAWPAQRVAVELEGGVWSGGRHARPAGIEGDIEKYNTATVEGWRVLRFTAKALDTDPAACIALLCEVLGEVGLVTTTPDTTHARPADVRATALATAVYDALAGFGPDTYPAHLAASVGWGERDFAAAVARVVAAARRELAERQSSFLEAA